ncbi:MAG: NnrS family protein [Betaproteobacteria bacterium]|nr:MAG: NnrS family protein [Betaproteobacteria bacterium]
MTMSIPVEPDSAGSPRRDNGFALFNLGFRPFYLLAALFAALSLPVWVGQYLGLVPAVSFVPALAWHTHEMVFGFAVAVVTGFLFTAARNWTGLPTPSGGTLAALAGLWLLGRVVMLTGPAPVAAVVDTAFLPAVAWCLWLPLRRARNRNQFFVAILAALAVVNAMFHASHLTTAPFTAVLCAQIGLACIVMIVAIMAGRVIPAFTRNAMRSARVRVVRGLDAASLLTLAAALVGWLASLPAAFVLPIAIAAAVVNGARLWSWDPWSTRGEPILWVLHLSYAWIPIGMVLLGLAVAGAAGSTALAVHALGVGAVGGMIVGMITRTARGHTGRPLRVSGAETFAYVLVHLAALMRVLVPLALPYAYTTGLIASAALWSAAFALYCFVYWPILTRPRIDGKPG